MIRIECTANRGPPPPRCVGSEGGGSDGGELLDPAKDIPLAYLPALSAEHAPRLQRKHGQPCGGIGMPTRRAAVAAEVVLARLVNPTQHRRQMAQATPTSGPCPLVSPSGCRCPHPAGRTTT